MNNKTEISSYLPLSDSEQITAPKKISMLLERFTKHYTPLTVEIKNHPQHYTSSIVAVEEKHILLDELLPATGHQLLLNERLILVKGKLEGVDIQFFTTLQGTGTIDNLLTYYMKLPKLLEYRQRRMTFRAHVPVSMKLPVFIDDNKGQTINGQLHNLSYGGAGIISLPDNSILEKGSLHECAIELPDSNWIYCTVELRYSKDVNSRKTQFIGAQFVEISATQSRLIGRCISALEREAIRNHTAP